MQIIVVEDEPKSREGILNILERYTDYEVLAVAENGREGLEAVKKYSPDLVISDIRMPVMGGLEMLEHIRQEKISLQAVLLTGYSDFEYARRALKLQVVDYVLKPLEVENFLEVLRKVEGKIEKNKVEKVSADQLLFTYFSGTEEEKERTEPVLQEALQADDRTQISLFLLSPCSLANETGIEMQKSTLHLLDSLCMENYYVFPLARYQGYVVMLVDTERNQNLLRVFKTRVLHALREISECHCCYGAVYGISGLYAKIEELKAMIQYGFSLSEEAIIDEELVKTIQFRELEYPDYLEQSIYREIRNGNYDKVRSIGEQFSKAVIESGGKPCCIREYVIRFTAGILRVSGEIRGNLEGAHDSSYILENMARSTSKRELLYQFEKILKAVASSRDTFEITENGMILNVIALIRNQYMRDITLSEAAEMCCVTPEYLSRIFCRETGVNFTSFLQNFRISMAKRFLLSGKYKVYEVSEMVGFHDQKYFVKVFKKLSGVTPSEYKRENHK